MTCDTPGTWVAPLADIVSAADGQVTTVGIAGFPVFPAPTYLALRERIPSATFSDASDLTADLRIVKSAAELDLMRAASRISDDAMRAGLAVIEDGATETAVAAAAEAVIRAAGAEPSFVTEMGSGARTALGTFLPGERRLAEGEVAVLDCGARLHGYHGDMCRTVVVGKPSPEQRRRLEAVEAAVGNAIAAIRPGVTVGATPGCCGGVGGRVGLRRQFVGRLHATRKRRRPARAAECQGAPRDAAA